MDPDAKYITRWVLSLGTIFIIIADVILSAINTNAILLIDIDIYILAAMLIIIISAVMFR